MHVFARRSELVYSFLNTSLVVAWKRQLLLHAGPLIISVIAFELERTPFGNSQENIWRLLPAHICPYGRIGMWPLVVLA